MPMKITRRELIRLTAVAATGMAILPRKTIRAFEQQFDEDMAFVAGQGLAIIQGLTTESATQVSVLLPTQMQAHCKLIDSETGKIFEPVNNVTMGRSFSSWQVMQVVFDELELGHTY